MKTVICVLILSTLFSCGAKVDNEANNSTNRKEILGREFSNSEVQSIEIIEIEHPMLGGIIETNILDSNQIEIFLNDFDQLKKKGIYKCGAKYVVRLNFESDTLRLKICNGLVSNRRNDVYYELENNKNIISDFLLNN